MVASDWLSFSVMWVDMIFAIVVVALGFVVGCWYQANQTPRSSADAERAQQALEKLRELASSVAQNVGEHTSRVKEISTDLSSQTGDDGPLDSQVLDSVADIIKANERLQSQLATAEVKLQRQAQEIETQTAEARTDPLTGLCNRRALNDEMTRRASEWQRRNTIFSLMMLDVDHFKKFNDKHGHQAGDEVLKGVAQVLQKTMREMDLVARFGGEEFAVVLPVTNLTDALRAAERARVAINESVFKFEGVELRVTASIGVAQMMSGDDPGTLIKRADAALYASKAAGRNCVHYHDGEVSHPAEANLPRPSNSLPPSMPPSANSLAVPPEIEQAVQAAIEPPAKVEKPIEKPVPKPVEKSVEKQVIKPKPNPPTPPSLKTFYSDLARHLSDCQKSGAPLSLLLVHVDDFKIFTQRLGTAVGQLVFQTISEFLASAMNHMDVASHYGNGQFAVMMPGEDLLKAAKMAERVRTALASCSLDVGGGNVVRITVTLGLVEAGAGDDSTALIKRAEAALGAAKAAGNNCTYVHAGDTFEPARTLLASSN